MRQSPAVPSQTFPAVNTGLDEKGCARTPEIHRNKMATTLRRSGNPKETVRAFTHANTRSVRDGMGLSIRSVGIKVFLFCTPADWAINRTQFGVSINNRLKGNPANYLLFPHF
ncbi:hypothetical protein BaRGS_00037753 [Batillaria attramentaria]|uniref:Uncharacterized protein n=1 Tax=Batillaria attramentaria TaxID=370345 RepID=A0ABD0J7X7_9CAEN